MDRFLDVYVDGHINSLVISGTPTEMQLHEAWNNIHEEYIDLIGDKKQKFYLEISKEAILLKSNKALIDSSICLLSEIYVKAIADRVIKIIGGNFKFDFTNPKEYQKDIQGLLNRSKSLSIELKLKESQLETLEKEQKGEQPTRDSFVVIFINLRSYYKYHVSTNITVFEFCKMLKELINYTEKINQNASRGKN